jgi:hypothetical protein
MNAKVDIIVNPSTNGRFTAKYTVHVDGENMGTRNVYGSFSSEEDAKVGAQLASKIAIENGNFVERNFLFPLHTAREMLLRGDPYVCIVVPFTKNYSNELKLLLDQVHNVQWKYVEMKPNHKPSGAVVIEFIQ